MRRWYCLFPLSYSAIVIDSASTENLKAAMTRVMTFVDNEAKKKKKDKKDKKRKSEAVEVSCIGGLAGLGVVFAG